MLAHHSAVANDPPLNDGSLCETRRLALRLPQLWCWADDFADLWTATGQRMVT
ncbi:hypothetical protein [Streptomyces sp. NPDC002156]